VVLVRELDVSEVAVLCQRQDLVKWMYVKLLLMMMIMESQTSSIFFCRLQDYCRILLVVAAGEGVVSTLTMLVHSHEESLMGL
jgi:hypothetical protein